MLICLDCNKEFEAYDDNSGLCRSCLIKQLKGIFNKPIAIDQQYLYSLLSTYILSLEGDFKEQNEETGLEESYISKSQLAESVSKILNKLGKDLEKNK